MKEAPNRRDSPARGRPTASQKEGVHRAGSSGIYSCLDSSIYRIAETLFSHYSLRVPQGAGGLQLSFGYVPPLKQWMTTRFANPPGKPRTKASQKGPQPFLETSTFIPIAQDVLRTVLRTVRAPVSHRGRREHGAGRPPRKEAP